MTNCSFTHDGLVIEFDERTTTVSATGEALRAWANRPGLPWPVSELQRLDSLRAVFNSGGLLELEAEGGCVSDATEFNAFTSDVLRPVLPEDHPAYAVAVGV